MLRIGRMMGMAMEGAFQKKHQEEAPQEPGSGVVHPPPERPGGMRKEVEEGHPQEDAAGERQQHLHPPVPQVQQGDRRSPDPGGRSDKDQFDDEHG